MGELSMFQLMWSATFACGFSVCLTVLALCIALHLLGMGLLYFLKNGCARKFCNCPSENLEI